MNDLSVGVFMLIGLAGTVVLPVCILRVLNRRAASRESNRRPFDPNHYQTRTDGAKEAAAKRFSERLS